MKRIFTTLAAIALALTISHAQTALNFDGNDDVVVVGNTLTNDLAGVTTFSVEAWVNSSSTAGNGVIVGNYNYPTVNSNMQFLLRRDGGQYTFNLNDGNGYQGVGTGAGTVITGQWQHVAGTWDGTSIRIYIDGVELGTNGALTGPGMPALPNEVVFGSNAMPESFTGSIDNVRIWNIQRSAADISATMNCEVIASETGLLAAYHFNDGIDSGTNTSNTLLFDNSGNGYNGTLQNFALTGATSNFVTSNRTDYMSIQSAIGSSAMADRMYPSEPADFNGDGFDDIIVATESGNRDIYYNDGLGHFDVPTAIPGTIGGAFAVGDIDNDGDVDLVNYAGSSFKVYVNDGTGNFTELATTNLNGTGSISALRIADVNGDGLADIVTGNGGTNATDLNEIWINTGTVGNPSFTYWLGLNSDYAPINSIAIGDIDNDGDIDLAFGGGSWPAAIFTNDNNTTFVQGQTFGGYNGGVRFIDWNQDGHLDLVNNDSYNNWGVRVRYNDGTGTFDQNTVTIVPGTLNLLGQVQYADMNGDGFLDVISRHWGGNGMIYLSNGCVVTQETACSYKLGPADNAVVIGDFNADGVPDVFCGARDRKSSVSLNFLDPVTTPALSHVTSTTGDEACDGDQASVEAVVSNTGDITWHSDLTGGTQLGTGSPFSTSYGPGSYTIYAQSENPNGCQSLREPTTIIVNENPDVALNNNSVTALDCFADSDGEIIVDVTLNGTATSSTYLWDNDGAGGTSTNQNLNNLPSGTYNLVLTDDNNCTVSLAVDITEPDELITSTVTTDALCNGDANGEIDLTVTGGTQPYGYVWDDATTSTTQNLTGVTAGIYSVDITDANGCLETTSATITEPDVIDATATTTTETLGGDGSIDLTVSGGVAPYSYDWTGPNGYTSTDQNPQNLVGGTYEVTVTDVNGCTFTMEVVVDSTVGLQENASINFNVYPNPTSGMFNISSPVSGSMDILNTNGQIIYATTIIKGKTEHQLTQLAKGVYSVRLTTEYGVQLKKLVIQ